MHRSASRNARNQPSGLRGRELSQPDVLPDLGSASAGRVPLKRPCRATVAEPLHLVNSNCLFVANRAKSFTIAGETANTPGHCNRGRAAMPTTALRRQSSYNGPILMVLSGDDASG